MDAEKPGMRNQPEPPPPGVVPYPWLPADDDANEKGYFVPTQAEIEQRCELFRNGARRKDYDGLDNQLIRVPVRRRAFDGVHIRE